MVVDACRKTGSRAANLANQHAGSVAHLKIPTHLCIATHPQCSRARSRASEWECVLEGRQRPPTLQVSVEKGKKRSQ